MTDLNPTMPEGVVQPQLYPRILIFDDGLTNRSRKITPLVFEVTYFNFGTSETITEVFESHHLPMQSLKRDLNRQIREQVGVARFSISRVVLLIGGMK